MNEQQRAAMQMALEALEEATTYTASTVWSPSMTKECEKAATALRSALAQPQGKWVDLTDDELMEVMCELAASNVVNDSVFADAIIAKFKSKNTPPSVEAAIEATKEKAAKVCEELHLIWDAKGANEQCAAAIRSMK